MSSEVVPRKVFVRKMFNLPSLCISARLLGQSAAVDLEGFPIVIELPKETSDKPSGPGEFKAQTTTWTKGKPSSCEVGQVNLLAYGDAEIMVTQEMLERGRQMSLDNVPEKVKTKISKFLTKADGAMERAFSLFIKTLRLKAMNAFIGREERQQTSFIGHLFDTETKCRLPGVSGSVIVFWRQAVGAQEWNAAVGSLLKLDQPPLHYDYYFDALAYFANGEPKRGILDLAIGTEVFMNNLIRTKLPTNLSDAAKEYILEAPARRMIEKIFPSFIKEKLKEYEALKPNLHKLFDLRNSVVHSGSMDMASQDECPKLAGSVAALLSTFN